VFCGDKVLKRFLAKDFLALSLTRRMTGRYYLVGDVVPRKLRGPHLGRGKTFKTRGGSTPAIFVLQHAPRNYYAPAQRERYSTRLSSARRVKVGAGISFSLSLAPPFMTPSRNSSRNYNEMIRWKFSMGLNTLNKTGCCV